MYAQQNVGQERWRVTLRLIQKVANFHHCESQDRMLNRFYEFGKNERKKNWFRKLRMVIQTHSLSRLEMRKT